MPPFAVYPIPFPATSQICISFDPDDPVVPYRLHQTTMRDPFEFRKINPENQSGPCCLCKSSRGKECRTPGCSGLWASGLSEAPGAKSGTPGYLFETQVAAILINARPSIFASFANPDFTLRCAEDSGFPSVTGRLYPKTAFISSLVMIRSSP